MLRVDAARTKLGDARIPAAPTKNERREVVMLNTSPNERYRAKAFWNQASSLELPQILADRYEHPENQSDQQVPLF
jgi:hypothetical protein